MIRLGIIGLGTMGKHILASALAHPSFEVLSIFDTRIQHLTVANLSGEQYQAIQLAASLDDMLNRDDIDLIYIGTPPNTHIEYSHLCLDKGKAIWCEKPLATDLVAAKALVSRIEALDAKAVINLSLASSPVTIALEAQIAKLDKSSFERVEINLDFKCWPRAWQQGASQWLDSPEQGGFLREVFSHFVFIHQRMFGPQSLLSSEVDYSKPLKSETSVKAHYVSAAPMKLPMSLTGRVDSSLEEGVLWTLYLKPEPHKPESHYSNNQHNMRAIRFQNWDSLLIGDDKDQWQPIPIQNQGSVETQLNEVEKMFRGEPHRLASFAEALAVQQVVEATLGYEP
jgi:1,5-anhydro-D-fructose reductase (1,5-anhydro-D-mannitol-forming)